MRDTEETGQRRRVGRRSVLGAGLAGTAAAALAACSDDTSSGDASPTSSARGPASSTVGTSAAPTTAPPLPAGLPADLFAAGVASGDPLHDSVILWTRLVADPLDPTGGLPDAPVPVRWEVADDEAFESVVADGTETAEARWAHSVHAEAGGLKPDSWYWYRFVVGDASSEPARTRTMPADDAAPDELRLAVASCQEFNSGSYAAYATLAADEPDVVLFLGDYIYEAGGGRMEPKVPVAEAMTLEDYRVQYAAYKRNPLLQAAHRVAPWVVTWDDHEVVNNYAGVHGPDGVTEADFAARRTAATQAYWEHMPLRGGPPDDGALQLYRSVKAGTLAEFFVLDGRQYRSDQPCGDRLAVPDAECPERDDEDRTMLGEEQERWLAEGLGVNRRHLAGDRPADGGVAAAAG